MTIEELLNPIEETHHMFQAMDQDIYNAVMVEACRGQRREH